MPTKTYPKRPHSFTMSVCHHTKNHEKPIKNGCGADAKQGVEMGEGDQKQAKIHHYRRRPLPTFSSSTAIHTRTHEGGGLH